MAKWVRTGPYAKWQGALNDIAAGDKTVLGGFRGGLDLATRLYPEGSMGRLDMALTPELARAQQGYEGLLSTAGVRTDETTQALTGLKDLIARAGTRSAETNRLIQERTKGLQGLGQEELVAQRDLGSASLSRDLGGALRSLRASNPGATGPAANLGARGILTDFANTRAAQERQLLLDDANARRAGLDSYEGTVRGIERDEFTNLLDSNSLYSGSLRDQQAFEEQARANALGMYSSFGSALDARNTERNIFNMDRANEERAGALNTIFGAGSTSAAIKAAREANEIAREQIEASKNAMFPMMGGSMPSYTPSFSGFPTTSSASGSGVSVPAATTFSPNMTLTPLPTPTYGSKLGSAGMTSRYARY